MSTDFNNLETSPRYRVSQPPFGLGWEWLRVITEKTCIGVKMPFWPRRGCVEPGRMYPGDGDAVPGLTLSLSFHLTVHNMSLQQPV